MTPTKRRMRPNRQRMTEEGISTSVYLSESTKNELERLANILGVSRNFVMRECLDEGLKVVNERRKIKA